MHILKIFFEQKFITELFPFNQGEDLGDEDSEDDLDEDEYDDYYDDEEEDGGRGKKKKKPSHGGFIIDEAGTKCLNFLKMP